MNRFKNNLANKSPNHISKHISRYQNSGSDAKELIGQTYPSPNPNVSFSQRSVCKTTPEKKNHQKDHRRTLREIQETNKRNALKNEEKQEKERARLFRKKQEQFGDVQSRVYDVFSAGPYSPRSFSSSNEVSTISNNSLTEESGFPVSCINVKNDLQPRFNSSGRSDSQSVHSNELLVTSKHKSFGKIPNYIRKRRAELQKEQEEKQGETMSGDINQPSNKENGHMVRMSEIERVETLSLLQKNEKKLKTQLMRLPFGAQSDGTIKKREALEIKMNEIQEAKKIFSNTKVYIFKD